MPTIVGQSWLIEAVLIGIKAALSDNSWLLAQNLKY